jgi:hypothetical protein
MVLQNKKEEMKPSGWMSVSTRHHVRYFQNHCSEHACRNSIKNFAAGYVRL